MAKENAVTKSNAANGAAKSGTFRIGGALDREGKKQSKA